MTAAWEYAVAQMRLLLVLALLMTLVATDSGAADNHVIALVGGRVLTSPDAPTVPDGVALIDGATITAVGPRGTVAVPPGATVIDCTGATVTAGFANSHVHFTAQTFQAAATAPAESLASALRAMLTSYGV